MLMLPISYIHGFEAGRLAASGGAVEARKRAAAANYPPHTGRKWLRISEFGANVAGGHKARLCPATGRGRAVSCVAFHVE